MEFSHLHVHTQYSLLDGAAPIPKLFKKAQDDGMPALAITDHGNMYGVFQFVQEAWKTKNAQGNPVVKPIVGCEFYLVDDRHKRQFTREDKDVRYHQLLLAKNEEGYLNLCKLCSIGFLEGFYGKYPRIDKEVIQKYHKGLIATTCCLGAEVPKTILKKGEEEAEKVFKWWLDLFGDDYYIELQRHDIPEQNKVNEVLLKWAEKYRVKVIASNDSHYVDQPDAYAHDILLCINTGEKISTPTNKEFSDDDVVVKGKRFAFANDQFYFKTTSEMSALFNDVPQAIDNTNEIVDKVDYLQLEKPEPILPNFEVPAEYANQMAYLRHLTYTGAEQRYKEITPEIKERLDFELQTIDTMGFAGYFLIVSDFIQAGRNMGVMVGPGRGSAAGSAVAYCIGITNIDPIKYDLLFERFLNPERKSMPDIDTDFDDEKRDAVIQYVIDKYGKEKVAQIVTYQSMGAKTAIRDVARVLDLPLNESVEMSKMVPEKPGIKLDRVLFAPLEGENGLKEKDQVSSDDIAGVMKLREIYETDDLRSKVLHEALVLEGSVRGTGVHAAGIIIAPKDLTEVLPIALAKDSNFYVTQYEGNVIEQAGVLKMDFLGLKTLSIIRDTLKLIKERHQIDIDIDAIPLDDPETFLLYQRAETNGTFQFESLGMQKHLKDLKPDKFGDLIAMNALFRPGPMDYIPNFIARKNGREAVVYDLPEMEELLSETYGVTVYQEQVMLLSQRLAGFSKGKADHLRKAMGKKDRKKLDELKPLFMEGAMERGHPQDKLEKIWTDWEKFAAYAFNKSHSTCYAFVAYQTGYLKTHYPAEYMASVLNNSMGQIDKITFFMDECKRMGLTVLGPDINESAEYFSVNAAGKIRFGLSGIKGMSEEASRQIIAERANGPYQSIFHLTKRVSSRSLNKKSLETLALAGAFDGFTGIHRAQYFAQYPDQSTTIDRAIRYGNQAAEKESAGTLDLFGSGESTAPVNAPEPQPATCEPWPASVLLEKEKEVIGTYISSHPLDVYKIEIEHFVTTTINDIEHQKDKDISICGIVTKVQHLVSKTNKPYARFTIQDYLGSREQYFFNGKDDKYIKFKNYLEVGNILYIQGRYEKKFRDSTDYDFNIANMMLMSSVMEKMNRPIKLQIPFHKIDTAFMARFKSIVEENPGAFPVQLLFNDPERQWNVSTTATKLKLTLTADMKKQLEAMDIGVML